MIPLAVYMSIWTVVTGSAAATGMMFVKKCLSKNHLLRFQKKHELQKAKNQLLHFVLIPAYKEDLDMLSITITNCAYHAEFAKKYIVMVVAMEARAGEEDYEKAIELKKRHRGLFRDFLVNFHIPEEIEGEVKGKSSNEQSAFLGVQRYLAGEFHLGRQQYLEGGSRVQGEEGEVKKASEELADWERKYCALNADCEKGWTEGVNFSREKTFLTIADADSLLHRQYFPLLTNAALEQSVEDRRWTIYQAPMTLFRNWERIPGFLRTSCYGKYVLCGGDFAVEGFLEVHILGMWDVVGTICRKLF